MRPIIPGTVLAVQGTLVTHYGICTERGTIITSSSALRTVSEIPIGWFLNGQALHVVGYPGTLSPYVVVERARRCIGRRYSLFSFNCEHLCRVAHGLPEESPQLQRALFLCAVVGIGLLALRHARA